MNKIEEFWYCVSPQEKLPLYRGEEIDVDILTNIDNFLTQYRHLEGTLEDRIKIKSILLSNPSSISYIRILVGVSDKRLYLDLTYIVHIYSHLNVRFVAEPREHLLKHDTSFFVNLLTNSPNKDTFAEIVADYFICKGLIDILNTFLAFTDDQKQAIFNNLIAPKEIQQMQAKYRGHGAEKAFAEIFHAFNPRIIPERKYIDPMAAHDPNVDLESMNVVTRGRGTHSFDLVVKDNQQIRILVQSLIHSSDPGQYGVNKASETIEIKSQIDAFNRNKNMNNMVFLLGSVDGVGFSENPSGTIERLLDVFDDFFQITTLFKIPLFMQRVGLINNVRGIAFDTNYFQDDIISHFQEHYLASSHVINMTNCNNTQRYTSINAGKATLYIEAL